MNVVILCIATVAVIMYTIITGIIAFVNYNTIGYYMYFLLIPIDIIVIIIITSDYIVYVTIVFF